MLSNPLVIVESPTKIRTIKKYLGKEYIVSATVGHIKDLPPQKIGVDLNNNFKPVYITVPGKQKIIKQLRKNARDTTEVYLAQDPDREGEAIAWHTAEVLKKKGRKFYRVLFHELTKKAIIKAISEPQFLDENKYKAQQTRRILDRLVGYEISPLLWNKVKRGLSAGRVQSVSVKIICDRESEIRAFEPTEYWSITVILKTKSSLLFNVKLINKNGVKIVLGNGKIVKDVVNELLLEQFLLHKITKKARKQNPKPPFTTSKLQQDAIRKLGFSAKKTMLVAQQLYEGVDMGPGKPTGLITYMRTDSTRISHDSALEALSLIKSTFGEKYALKEPRFFKNKKKVQDAHEAIRPTSVFNTPEKVKKYLSEDQQKLYNKIWQRFVSSQMEQAIINQNTLYVKAGDYMFSSSVSSIKFLGFMVLNQTKYNCKTKIGKNGQHKLLFPDLTEGTVLNVSKILPIQHFTQSPHRFSEATLVKELEEKGIGRPSTYISILSNIQNKGYVELLNKNFKPTELGFVVNDLLTKSFPDIINVEFTATMEDKLDQIEQAEINATEVLSVFYNKFSKTINEAEEKMLSVKSVGISTNIECPKCKKKKLRIKVGKNGPFLACSKYPKCTYSSDYDRDEKGNVVLLEIPNIELIDKKCERCGSPMIIKMGKYGRFLACSDYPSCDNTCSISNVISSNDKIGVKCPEDGCDGEIVKRLSKRGKTFYACNQFPKCNFVSWYKLTKINCPECKLGILVEKITKQNGKVYTCLSNKCNYTDSIT